MEHQNHINEAVSNTPRSMPCYIYELADYKYERLLSFVPISAGDYITVRLTTGIFLRDKKVTRVTHLEHTVNVGKQILSAFLALADD